MTTHRSLLTLTLMLTACGAPGDDGPDDTGDSAAEDTASTADTSAPPDDTRLPDTGETTDTGDTATQPTGDSNASVSTVDTASTADTADTALPAVAGWSAPLPVAHAAAVDDATGPSLMLRVGPVLEDGGVNLFVSGLAGMAEVVIVRVDRADAAACTTPCATSSTAHWLGTVPSDANGLAELSVGVPSATQGTFHAFEAVQADGTQRSPAVVAEVSGARTPSLFGSWATDFGGSFVVDGWAYTDGTDVWRIYGDLGTSLITRNDPGNAFNPGLWTRFDLVTGTPGWICFTAFDAASYGDAFTAPAADASDPAAGGCGGFSWTSFTAAAFPHAGSYTDAFGTQHQIDQTRWTQDASGWTIASADPEGAWVIAQNDPSNGFFPGLWSRFDLLDDGTDLFYCQTAFAAPTYLDARRTPAADAGDLTSGCGGFGWTNLTP